MPRMSAESSPIRKYLSGMSDYRGSSRTTFYLCLRMSFYVSWQNFANIVSPAKITYIYIYVDAGACFMSA